MKKRLLAAEAPRPSKMGGIPPDPGNFRKNGKHRGYGMRNLEEHTENRIQERRGNREDKQTRV